MDKLFNPKKIAVIGASHDKTKVGHIIFENLLKKKKKTYPVNVKTKKILGEKVYPSVLDIKGKIDLAILAVPAKIVPSVMKEVVEKEIPYTIVISSGFSETGNKKLEKEVNEIARGKTRVLGPNCIGLINPHKKVNASFFEGMPSSGNVAFISQSGAIGIALLDWVMENNIGFSKFVSVGNSIDIDFDDLIDYLNKDKKTKSIFVYMEAVKEGKNFLNSLKKSKKPIYVMKAGNTKAGEKAAFSHTAALATEDEIYSGVIKQGGATRVDTLQQLFKIAEAHTVNQIPKGNKGVVVTNAGGLGVIISDAFERSGLEFAKIPKTKKDKLNKILPPLWSKGNPVDIVGDATPKRYEKTIKTLKGKYLDFIIVMLTPQKMSEPEKTANAIVKLNKKSKVPIYTCFMGGDQISLAKNIFRKNKIVHFDEPEDAAKVINKMVIN